MTHTAWRHNDQFVMASYVRGLGQLPLLLLSLLLLLLLLLQQGKDGP